MESILPSIIGGSIPALAVVAVYFLSTEKRLTRIETDISWLKRELPTCRPPSEKNIR